MKKDSELAKEFLEKYKDDIENENYTFVLNMMNNDYYLNKCKNKPKMIRNLYKIFMETIPDFYKEIKIIPPYAYYKENIHKIYVPNNIASIDNFAFLDCSSLSEVILNEGLLYIYDFAFQNCTSLKEITLPKGLKGVFPLAFEGCNNLKKINIPEETYYDWYNYVDGSPHFSPTTKDNWKKLTEIMEVY